MRQLNLKTFKYILVAFLLATKAWSAIEYSKSSEMTAGAAERAVIHKLKLTNNDDELFKIGRITSDCGCTSVSCKAQVIEPHSSVDITVRVNTVFKNHDLKNHVVVALEGKTQKLNEFLIITRIKPVIKIIGAEDNIAANQEGSTSYDIEVDESVVGRIISAQCLNPAIECSVLMVDKNRYKVTLNIRKKFLRGDGCVLFDVDSKMYSVFPVAIRAK
jgi:hypothetical protein